MKKFTSLDVFTRKHLTKNRLRLTKLIIALTVLTLFSLTPTASSADEDVSIIRENLSLEGKGFQSWLEGIRTIDLIIPRQTEAYRETIKERFITAGIKIVEREKPADARIALFLVNNANNKSSLMVYQEVLLKRDPKVKTFAIPTYSLNVPTSWASGDVSCNLLIDQFLYDFKMANKIINKNP